MPAPTVPELRNHTTTARARETTALGDAHDTMRQGILNVGTTHALPRREARGLGEAEVRYVRRGCGWLEKDARGRRGGAAAVHESDSLVQVNLRP